MMIDLTLKRYLSKKINFVSIVKYSLYGSEFYLMAELARKVRWLELRG